MATYITQKLIKYTIAAMQKVNCDFNSQQLVMNCITYSSIIGYFITM